MEGSQAGDDAKQADIDAAKRRQRYLAQVHRVQEDVSIPKSLQHTLMPHQVEALDWLVSIYNNCEGGLLADEMGLGKTVEIISLFAYLREKRGVMGPFLIIVSYSTLIVL